MSKIEIKNVYKIFGSNPDTVLPIVKEGASKEEVLSAISDSKVNMLQFHGDEDEFKIQMKRGGK